MELQRCRVCLVSATPLQDLSEDVKNAFEDILGFTIILNNLLPSHICYICKARILRYAEFKKFCWDVQASLEGTISYETQAGNNAVEQIRSSFPAKQFTVNEVFNFCFIDNKENETENNNFDDHFDYDSNLDEPKKEEINNEIIKNERNNIDIRNMKIEGTEIEVNGWKKPNQTSEVKLDHKNIENHIKMEGIHKDKKIKKQESNQSSEVILIDSDSEDNQETIIKKAEKTVLNKKENIQSNTDKIKNITSNKKYKLCSTTITKISKTNNKNNLKSVKPKVDVSKKHQIASKKEQIVRNNLKLRKIAGEKLRVKVMKWQCAECKFVFVSEQALSKHMDSCNLGKRPSGVCGAGFPDALALHQHLASAHIAASEDNVYSKQSKKDLGTDKRLPKQWKGATQNKKAEQTAVKQTNSDFGTSSGGAICDQCGKQFKCQATLRYHMTAHTGERPYQCEICFKSFRVKYGLVTPSLLRRHMTKHTGERPFQCDVCHKTFPVNATLKTHKMMHTGLRPFQCSVCPATFRQHSHRLRHMRTHTGEKPYDCKICGKSFACTYNRNAHIRTVHEGQPCRQRPGKRKLSS